MSTITQRELRQYDADVRWTAEEIIRPARCIRAVSIEWPPCPSCGARVHGDAAVILDATARTVTFQPCGCTLIVVDPLGRPLTTKDALMTDPARDTVQVLLLFGDQAELITPDHDAGAPLRMSAATIAADADLPVNELPGRRFSAVPDGTGSYRDFRLLDDPRV